MTLRTLFIIPFLFTATLNNQSSIKLATDSLCKPKPMGISINIYRVAKAEKLDDLKDLDNQIARTADTKVDLYKIGEDLAVIFLNSTEPFSNTNTIPYKMLYGKATRKQVTVGEIGGFLPASEVAEITKWLKTNKIETYEGFSKMYDHLSAPVKKLLHEMGADTKVNLFNAYVRPLVVLYFTALENQNSVVFIGQ